jgi:hypothetical protein
MKLKDKADMLASERKPNLLCMRILSKNGYRPLVCDIQSAEQVQEGALSRTRSAPERNHLATMYLYTGSANHLDAAPVEALPQFSGFDDQLGCLVGGGHFHQLLKA